MSAAGPPRDREQGEIRITGVCVFYSNPMQLVQAYPCGWETLDHIGETKLLSGKALATTSRKARTLALTRRREL
jgi:hypothetical protein